jgi:hypothetical protein
MTADDFKNLGMAKNQISAIKEGKVSQEVIKYVVDNAADFKITVVEVAKDYIVA